MSDSIQLMTAKQNLQSRIRKIEDKKFAKGLATAKEMGSNDEILQDALFWIETLTKAGCSPTSIITAWAAIKSRRPTTDEVA